MGIIYNHKIILLVLLVLCLATPTALGVELENPGELEAFFDGIFAVQLGKHFAPGATVAVVQGQKVLFSKGYGYANLEQRIPMDPSILHRPGSNSKIFVWTAVFQLVEEGLLDLYVDINTYLDFPIPATIAGRKEAPPITLHHLLTHSSGFEDEVMELFVASAEQLQPLGQYVRAHLPARVFAPGSVMAYSNYGTSLAAYIVEQVSGQSFDSYVEDNILQPLGMTSSTFQQPLPDNLAPQMSIGYRFVDGKYMPAPFEYVQSYPAGGLTSSTLDMVKLIQAHLNLGSLSVEQLTDETDEEVTTEQRILQIDTAQLMQTQQFTVHPEVPGMTYGFIEADYNGYRVLSHGGDTFLFTTGLYFLPEENVGLYFAYNAPVGEKGRRALFEGFMNRYFPPADIGQTAPSPIAEGTEGNYQGIFHTARSNFSGIERILALLQTMELGVDQNRYVTLRSSGQTTHYGEIAPGLFQELHGTTRIAFTFEDGKVTRIQYPGPFTYLRSHWSQAPFFLGTLLACAVLFMFSTIIGWIKQIFRINHQRKPFVLPKIIGLTFIVFFLTNSILFIDALNTVHPGWGVPLLILEPNPTLNTLLLFAKLVIGLGAITILTSIYLWITKRGTLWQRIYYTGLSLSVASVLWIFWQINFF